MSASHEDIARRAYQLWRERGCPLGSPEVDWEQAEQQLSGSHAPDGAAGGMSGGVRPSAVQQPNQGTSLAAENGSERKP